MESEDFAELFEGVEVGDEVEFILRGKVHDIELEGLHGLGVFVSFGDFAFSAEDLESDSIRSVKVVAPPLPTTPGSVVQIGSDLFVLLGTDLLQWAPVGDDGLRLDVEKAHEQGKVSVLFDVGANL